ncbi:MAG TPA: SH3 domain-containing protein [Phototrophicaceae bacterium]|jgi:uncharacterized protein YgiM (DUF1202 family)|nr:SH3 domain-containing protein [Phototrophicaceae bacterium]
MKQRSKIVSLIVLLAIVLGTLSSAGAVFAAGNEQRVNATSPVMIVNSSFLNVRTGPGIQYAVMITVVGGTTLPVLGVASDHVWYQVSTVIGVGWVNSQYVLPRGDFSRVPQVEAPALIDPRVLGTTTVNGLLVTTTDETAVDAGFSSGREWGISVVIEHSLKAQPAMSGADLAFQPADTSIIYSVVGAAYNEGVNWIQVDVPGIGAGWLEASKVVFRPFACSNFSAVSVTQNVELKRGPDGSGVNGGIFMTAGAEAYLLDRKGDLYKIELNTGTVGWLEGSFIHVRQAGEVKIPFCDQVASNIASGATNTRPTFFVDPSIAQASIPHVVINTGFLNIRSGPGAQFTPVYTAAGGAEFSVIGIAPDRVWYLVQGPFGQGWLNSEFVLFRGDGSHLPIIRGAVGNVATPTAVVNRAGVIVYAAPNLTLGSIGTLNTGAVVDVVARTADFKWVQLNTSFGFGWVQAEFVTVSGDSGLIPVVGG